MPSEAELRRILHGEPDPAGTLDADRIIRRARARRRPRQLAAGAAGVLALAVIAVPVAVSTGGWGSGAADSAAGGYAAESVRITAEDQLEAHDGLAAGPTFVCGADLDAATSAPSAFTATVDSPTGAGGDTTQVMVAIVNVSEVQLSGTLSTAPELAVARDGVIVATSVADAHAATPIELAPGAAMLIPVWLPLAACDALAAGDGTLPAGAYTLSAAVALTSADGSTEQAVGPPSPFQIRVP